MAVLSLAFMVVALVLFILAAIPATTNPRLGYIGWAFMAASFIVAGLPVAHGLL